MQVTRTITLEVPADISPSRVDYFIRSAISLAQNEIQEVLQNQDDWSDAHVDDMAELSTIELVNIS